MDIGLGIMWRLSGWGYQEGVARSECPQAVTAAVDFGEVKCRNFSDIFEVLGDG
jgi:hypothetical protein